jgi:uncharacterized protein (DUF1697 family)
MTFLSEAELRMKTYVAFLRAINVGGHAVVKMTDLRDAFAAAGCQGVRTYIQTGNVLFESPDENTSGLFQAVRVQLRELLGQEPGIAFRTVRELERLVGRNPFRGYEEEPGIKLYVTHLSGKPSGKPRFPLQSSKEALEAIGMKNLDVLVLSRRKSNGMYGFPNIFLEKELGVPATTRNWSTVTKLIAFARKPDVSGCQD